MSPFLLGVSLLSWDRVLGRTLVYLHGESSGFFVFGRYLVRRIATPRPPNALVRIFLNLFSFLQPEKLPAKVAYFVRTPKSYEEIINH